MDQRGRDRAYRDGRGGQRERSAIQRRARRSGKDVQRHVRQRRDVRVSVRPAHVHARGDPRYTQRRSLNMITLRSRAIGLAAALAIGVALRGAGQSSMSNMSTSQPSMSASDLRVALNTLLAEHIYLAGSATGAALGGRTPEFQAAAGTLDSNSVAIAKAIGSIYGEDAGTAFLALWRKHIGFVVDYTTGVATKNKMKQDKAVQDLLG